MSLYGLDIILDRNGKPWISEINGITSGMHGFQEIYEDNRVERKVISMLREKYGKLSIYDKSLCVLLGKNASLKRYAQRIDVKTKDEQKKVAENLNVLKSRKAVLDWSKDKPPKNETKFKREILNFEEYAGQDSNVINAINLPVKHPKVNPYNAEQVSRNKFFQYWVLKDSEISENIIPSALVGMGATDEGELERLVSQNESFIIKPINFSNGIGIRKIGKKEAEKYIGTRGKLFPDSLWTSFLPNSPEEKPGLIKSFKFIIEMSYGEKQENDFKYKYFSEMAGAGDFEFEFGLALIQPFIDSRNNLEEDYSYIRAIVCNGKFVDAYERLTKIPIDNSPRKARLKQLNSYENKLLPNFSEKVIDVFEKTCEKLDFNLEKQIYQEYVEATGRPEELQDKRELIIGMNMIDMLTKAIGEIKK